MGGDARWHPDAQSDAVRRGRHLEGHQVRSGKQVVTSGKDGMEVAPERGGTLGVDGGRHLNVDELARRGRPMPGDDPHTHHQGDEDCEGHSNSDCDGQDGVGDAGQMLAEIGPPRVGMGEEVGQRAIRGARRWRHRGGGWQMEPPVIVRRMSRRSLGPAEKPPN